jgi:hypothetical protein
LNAWQIMKKLNDIGIDTEIVSIEKIKKDGLEMDYTNKNKDTKVRIQAPIDQWESFLEKGLFEAVVNEVPDFKPCKNNEENHNLIIPIQFLDGINKGKKANYLLTFTPKSLGRCKRIFDNVGFKYTHDGSGLLDFDCNDFKGLKLKAMVDEDNYQGKITNKITMIFHKDYIPEE